MIKEFVLEGFHHDEYGSLEKSGLFKFITKTYGDTAFGAEECFIGTTDWSNGITCNKDKTFFPSSWSKQTTVKVIFEANKNRIEELQSPSISQRKFLCLGPDNMLIDVIVDLKDKIISAYPNIKNFLNVKED